MSEKLTATIEEQTKSKNKTENKQQEVSSIFQDPRVATMISQLLSGEEKTSPADYRAAVAKMSPEELSEVCKDLQLLQSVGWWGLIPFLHELQELKARGHRIRGIMGLLLYAIAFAEGGYIIYEKLFK
jgi:hypothetical protein